jgi:hypothetical protein
MLTFTETPDGYIFTNSEQALALGIYENGKFMLLHNDKMLAFSNAISAFSHLRSLYEPKEVSSKTMKMFLTPSRPIDNMSKYRDNINLANMPKEVFHANLPN